MLTSILDIFPSVDARGDCYRRWSIIVAIAVVYNLITIPMLVFDEFDSHYYGYWVVGNIISDALFLADAIVQSKRGRARYLNHNNSGRPV